MIDHGRHPDHAHATLRCKAAATGVEPHIYAARLLGPAPQGRVKRAPFDARAVGAGRLDP
jgi:hypothetical protein